MINFLGSYDHEQHLGRPTGSYRAHHSAMGDIISFVLRVHRMKVQPVYGLRVDCFTPHALYTHVVRDKAVYFARYFGRKRTISPLAVK
jgi:hypothetical protein